ncbi:MAG: hypothetical protein II649_12190 [Kiritimatiellae bacterium]|nr:hypothetical protein [Kiritimatiellia bacterium]MBQ5795522.1 hypothetical protein [Kiritimatiellia bacterium]
MSNREKTAGKTANGSAAGAAHNNRFTEDGDLIYRPIAYPFEVVEGSGYVVQTRLFTDEAGVINTSFLTKDGGEALFSDQARIFDDAKSAAKAAAKVKDYPEEQEDGNFYPRVLKVRLSWIVEGVAFESVVREIEGGAKLKGVA